MGDTDASELADRVARLEEALAFQGRRKRDWDGYSAVIASLVGLLALLVAGYTANLQRQQVRAEAWTRVEIGSSNVDRKLYASNPGVGPARIEGVKVQVGGKTVHTWDGVMEAFGYPDGGFTYSALNGRVLPAGANLVILSGVDNDESRAMMAAFLENEKGFAMTICYCSVLDECWITGRGHLPDGFKAYRPIDECPIAEADQFRN